MCWWSYNDLLSGSDKLWALSGNPLANMVVLMVFQLLNGHKVKSNAGRNKESVLRRKVTTMHWAKWRFVHWWWTLANCEIRKSAIFNKIHRKNEPKHGKCTFLLEYVCLALWCSRQNARAQWFCVRMARPVVLGHFLSVFATSFPLYELYCL